MRRVHESCCTMTTIAFVETKFVKKTVNPRFIHPVSKTRSIPHRLPLRSRTYSPSPDLYLRLQGGFRYFFAHSSVSIHRLSRSHTLLQSSRPSVVSSAPRTHTGLTVLPLTAHRSSRPHLIRRSSVAQLMSWDVRTPGLTLAFCVPVRVSHMHAFATGLRRNSTPAGASSYSFVHCRKDGFHFLVDTNHSSGSHRFSQPGVTCLAL